MTPEFVELLIIVLFGLIATNIAQASESAENCIYARDVKQFEILSDEIILLHGKFDRLWVNRLKARCAGLHKNMIVQLDRYGSQMCANDRFKAQERGTLVGEGTFTSCRLGPFEEVLVEQVATLKRSLQES